VAGPKAEAGKDVYICRGETAKIGGMPTATGGSGNYRYIWSPASSLNKNNISNPEATPDHTTEYVLTVTDNSGQGCKDRDTVTVTIKNNPDVRASADTSVCIGGTVIITAHGGIKYLWNTLDTLSALTLSPESTSQYFVTITDTAYCSSTESVKITVSPLPEASFTPGFGNTPNKFIFSNTSTGASSYSWDFGDGDKSKEKNPSHHYTDSKGKHRVTLIADNGPPDYCTDTFSLEVISSGITKIPDIFFPKNSHNKEFAMEATGITELEVSIFNRWGNKISERKSIDYIISSTGEQNIVLWDGRIEGISEAEAGVYFYILSATGADSRTFEFHGTVTLIR
jgi:PKD repeat protein